MQGLSVDVMKRKGKCQACKCEIPAGSKSVVLGSYNNTYRYCLGCFGEEISYRFECFLINDNDLYLK